MQRKCNKNNIENPYWKLTTKGRRTVVGVRDGRRRPAVPIDNRTCGDIKAMGCVTGEIAKPRVG